MSDIKTLPRPETQPARPGTIPARPGPRRAPEPRHAPRQLRETLVPPSAPPRREQLRPHEPRPAEPRPQETGGGAPRAAGTARRLSGPARAGHRMPFVILLCGLLAGALASLLVISTTLASGAFRITTLQQQVNQLSRERQQLQQTVAADQSAQVIAQRAYRLGMRPQGQMRFLDLKDGKVRTNAGSGAVTHINVPGYTP